MEKEKEVEEQGRMSKKGKQQLLDFKTVTACYDWTPIFFFYFFTFNTRDLSCDHHVITYVTYCFVTSIVCDPFVTKQWFVAGLDLSCPRVEFLV